MSILPLILAVASLALVVVAGRDFMRETGSGQGGRGWASGGSGRERRPGRSGPGRPPAGPLRLIGASAGMILGFILARIVPGRPGSLFLAGAILAGFFLPDLLRARAARMRHRRMIAALPDALDLLAVSVAAGRGLAASLADLAGSGRGPLAGELARTGEEMAWGAGQAAALGALRDRVGGPQITTLVATLDRSRRLGSPLADQLRRQSAGLRQDRKREIEEEAARAAPKIQLVIALVLVPSVLLLMVAALIANADTLLPAGA